MKKCRFVTIGLILGLGWNSFQLDAQMFNDPCFTSPSVGTTFAGTANVSNNNSDLLNWNGSAWTGAWGGANITLAPPGSLAGTRAIWSGDGTVWTTGGEGFGLRLTSSIVTGTTYSFNYTRVSHGTGQNGNFRPNLYTNTTGTFGTLVGAIPTVGTAWTTTAISFTATAGQSGHTWVYFHNVSGSGMFLACLATILPMEFSNFRAWPDQLDAQLAWTIRNEENYAFHQVEGSRNGVDFDIIGKTSSQEAGDNAHTYTYRANGWVPPVGQVFYFRIRSVDKEGIEALSPVIVLTSSQKVTFFAEALPNPVPQTQPWRIRAYLNQLGPVRYSVSSMEGKTLKIGEVTETQYGMNEWALPCGDLPPGAYVLRLGAPEGESVLKMLVTD